MAVLNEPQDLRHQLCPKLNVWEFEQYNSGVCLTTKCYATDALAMIGQRGI